MFGKHQLFRDGVSFAYKRHPLDQRSSPKGRIWRKPGEGLDDGRTAKGKKEGSGGTMVKLIIAISYNKGVIDCEQYKKMSGEFFKSYIAKKFPVLFKLAGKPHSKLWIQDGDPCQNSYAAKTALTECGAELLSIPPRSPDINPIENLFHLVRRELDRQALSENITHVTLYRWYTVDDVNHCHNSYFDNFITKKSTCIWNIYRLSNYTSKQLHNNSYIFNICACFVRTCFYIRP